MAFKLMRANRLADAESCSVRLPAGSGGGEAFIVRKAGRFFAYINRCPHTGAPLDWMPDQFLDAQGEFIICAVHGALFEIENGHCVQGPCAGRSLESLPLTVNDGYLFLDWPDR